MGNGAPPKLVLLLVSASFCLIALEVAARLVLPDQYFVWRPNLRRVNETTDEFMHGVWGPTTFTINAHGMRGEPYDRDYRYRILAIGGSTTICGLLDDKKAWPRVVQEIVNEQAGPKTLFVGNVGRPGHTIINHVVQAEKLLAQHEDIDAVLILAGVNDLIFRLNFVRRRLFDIKRDTKPDPPARHDRDFNVIPARIDGPWYKGAGIASWLASRRFRAADAGGPVADAQGEMIVKQMEFRRTTTRFVDELPNLDRHIAAYGNKLSEIVDVAQASGVRPILLTQPSIWREGLPRDAERRLWFGGPPLNQPQEDAEYFTVRALAEGLAKFNEKMLDVCRDREVECIDLDGVVAKESDVFVDDVHYTDRGSRRIAEIVAAHLLRNGALVR